MSKKDNNIVVSGRGCGKDLCFYKQFDKGNRLVSVSLPYLDYLVVKYLMEQNNIPSFSKAICFLIEYYFDN